MSSHTLTILNSRWPQGVRYYARVYLLWALGGAACFLTFAVLDHAIETVGSFPIAFAFPFTLTLGIALLAWSYRRIRAIQATDASFYAATHSKAEAAEIHNSSPLMVSTARHIRDGKRSSLVEMILEEDRFFFKRLDSTYSYYLLNLSAIDRFTVLPGYRRSESLLVITVRGRLFKFSLRPELANAWLHALSSHSDSESKTAG
jgi:hypothetical protein